MLDSCLEASTPGYSKLPHYAVAKAAYSLSPSMIRRRHAVFKENTLLSMQHHYEQVVESPSLRLTGIIERNFSLL